MTKRYKKKEEESGVRLITLLQTQGSEILKREADNDHFIHLYCTGGRDGLLDRRGIAGILS